MMAVVTGCSSSTGYFIGDSRNSAPRRAADVLVVDHVNASDYQVIGRVHAQSTAPQWLPWSLKSREALLQQLKKQAALLHADVIFDVRRYSRSQFEWQEEHLMATAAVIIKKRAGDAP
ncbi:MAG TPA: hypothetical protein VG938_12085 [Verrucomicrobiae bacterium]|nr:hypothetical protein [Verrucomicrobiae bacterium]